MPHFVANRCHTPQSTLRLSFEESLLERVLWPGSPARCAGGQLED